MASVCAGDNNQTNDELSIENQNDTVLSCVSEDNLGQNQQEPVADRQDSQINIDADSVHVNETAKISINVQNATGYVIVSVDNHTFNKTLNNSNVMLNVSGLTAGSHNIAVFYSGNDYYLSGFKLETLFIKKLQAKITDIDIDEVFYGEDAVITVSVPQSVTGDIIIRLNDTLKTNITERIYDGRAVFSIPGLAAGSYAVNVVYVGNGYYEVNDTESRTFEVKRANPDLSIVSFEGVVFDNATILISLNEEIIDEIVNITVDGVKYIQRMIYCGAVEFTTPVLDEMRAYNITVTYGGNDNFNSSKIQVFGTPRKITTYGIKIIAHDIAVHDDEIISVEVPDHVDDVVIWVDGKTYRNTSFTGNNATFKITGLKEGVYNVTATVNDTEFDHKNFTTIFKVYKVHPSISINIINETPIHVGDRVKITVNVPEDVADNVSIMYGDIQLSQKPVNGNATFYIDCLSQGIKTIPAIYYGDEKYYTLIETVNFTVYRLESFVNISAQNISINQSEEIIFTLPGDASGNITVFVNGERYTVAVSGGKAILVLYKLHKGEYHVNATYNGDGKYLASQNSTEWFKVIINSDQMDVIDEMNATVSVYLNENAKGNVTVEIEGVTFNATVINGTAKVVISNATMGTHHAYVRYSDSESSEVLESSIDVHIPKYDTPLDVASSVMKIGEVGHVNVSVPKSASGNITIEIDGVSYKSSIKDGIAEFNMTFLSAGDKTLYVKYIGDDNFTENSTSYILKVFKRESSVNVTVEDIKVGQTAQIMITVPSDILGTVIVSVNGVNYTAVVSNGSGLVEVDNLENGKYNVTVNYLENEKYLSSVAFGNLTVTKTQTGIVFSDVVCEYNDDCYLVATLKDINGNPIAGVELSVNINGVKLPTTDDNGQVKISLVGIAPNNYNVVVSFDGNGRYVKSEASIDIHIPKYDTPLDVASSVMKIGEVGHVNVSVPKSASGNITIEIDGVSYKSSIKDGIAEFNMTFLSAGDKTLYVKYIGDDNFTENSTSYILKVFKRESSVNVTVEDIKVGQTAQIMITVPSDILGTVIVSVNGVNYTAVVSNGSGLVEVDNLENGKYNVTVNYLENEKYLSSVAFGNLTVTKTQTGIVFSDVVCEYNDDCYLVATLKDINGNPIAGVELSVTLNGVKHVTTDGNGQVKVSVAGIVPNNYNVAVSFDGDGRYVKSSVNVKLTISKATPVLSAAGKNFKSKVKTKKYTVALKTNKNTPLGGFKVILKIKNKKYIAKTGSKGKATFSIKKLNKKGKYSSTVTFEGNAYYNQVSKKVKIIVK